jgi:nucleoside-diphosphate-sugar epimerase
MNKILLTGSTGFIGSELLRQIKLKKYLIHTSSRSTYEEKANGVKNFIINQIDNDINWSEALEGVDCVIHCAGVATETYKSDTSVLSYYRKINVEGTRNLAYQAAAKGVKRFIFISSIKVNGERTEGFSSFKNTDIPKPEGIYAISKWEAEQSLHSISKQTGLEIVNIRTPIVYGQQVKGNFYRLINFIDRGFPLPFGKVNNLRSYVALDNLVDLIICCINHPKATGQTFLVSDGEDLSTSGLIKKISFALQKKPFLLNVPISLMKFAGKMSGKSKEINRLLSSLRLDFSYTQKVLDWKPNISIDNALLKTTNWYLKKKFN